MKLSEIQTLTSNNKKFSVSKEKLKVNWEYLSKIYSLGEKVDPGCEKCTDGRIKKQAYPGFGYSTELCSCVDVAKEMNEIIDELVVSGISPAILRKYTLSGYMDGMFSLDETEQLLNKDGWLYAHGDVGTGKTYLAFIGLYMAVCSGYTVQYANVPKLLDMLRPSDKKDDDMINSLCEVDFLILDDLGQEKCSIWTLERLYIIINERYIHNKKTVITSNWSIDKLTEKLGHKAIVSRIRGSSTQVEFIGFDKR